MSLASSSPSLLLGSSSLYRKQLLSSLYPNFTCISPNIDEYSITDGIHTHSLSDPALLVQAISNKKCDRIIEIRKEQDSREECIIVTADQVAIYGKEIREKPKDEEELKKWWREYSNGQVAAVTCITVYNTKNKIRKSGTKYITQKYKYIPQDVIDKLIENGEVYDCCGGFIVSNDIIQLYLDVADGTRDEVMGFPLKLLQDLISEVNL